MENNIQNSVGKQLPTLFFHRTLKGIVALLIVLCFGITSPEAQAQKLSKYYKAAMQDHGMLYFIKPMELFKSKAQQNDFIFDVTYLNNLDSVTLNFSYFDEESVDISALHFLGEKDTFQVAAKQIFVESKKKQWHYRYTTTISFADLMAFYQNTTAPQLAIALKEETPISLVPHKKKWKKNLPIIQRILVMIDKN